MQLVKSKDDEYTQKVGRERSNSDRREKI